MNATIHRPLLRWEEREPDRPAIRDRGKTYTYAQVAEKARHLAAHLLRAGVQPGDRIGLHCGKTVDQMAAVYALSMAGAITVFMNPLLRRPQIERMVRDVGIRGLVISPEKVKLVVADLDRSLPLEFLLCLKPLKSKPEDLVPELIQAREDPGPIPDTWPRIVADDPAAIIFTSGSTGTPRGTTLSHRHLLEAGTVSVDHLGIRDNDHVLNVLPISFDYGLSQLQMCMEAGAMLVLHSYMTPATLAATLVTETISVLQLTPVVWGDLLTVETEVKQNPPTSLRLMTNSGAHLPVEYGRRLRRLFPGADLVLMYGLTEAFRSSCLPPREFDGRPDSMGKALPGVELFVVNEAGQLCRPGEIGELVHRGATCFQGYWGDPEKTAERLRPHPFPIPGMEGMEKVVYTGDLVRTDEEGFLYFVGRKDFLIKSGGFRIGPEEIEEALLATGLVREAGVHGVEDDKLGHQILAHVIPGNGCIDADEIIARLRQSCPRYMVPHAVILRNSLPRTSTGKIDRAALIAEGKRA